MAIRNLTLVTAVWATLVPGVMPLLAQADDEVAAPMITASAPGPARRPDGPLLRTPAERRSDAMAPDLRPARAVVPQIDIPLGRTRQPVRPKAAQTAPERAAAASGAALGGISDGAARCEAQVSDLERAACRARLAHQSLPR